MIKFEHIKKVYPEATPHKDINGVINDGEIVTIIGPSGTGKSTLLRMINGLEKPTSGKIYIDGEDITAIGFNYTKIRRKIGMIFQSFNLFNNLSVLDNLVLPQLDILKIDKNTAREKAMDLLKKMGLDAHYHKDPSQLSGGQKQRVAIARALVMEPEVILFDEPTSALDPAMVGEVENTIKWLAESNITMVIVTHDMKFAKDISTKIFYLDEGEIYEEGTPSEIFDNPKRSRTKAFVSNQRLIDILIDGNSYNFEMVNNKLTEFGYTQKLDPKLIYNMSIIFEELIVQTILSHKKDAVISLSLFFNGEDLEYKIKFNGPRLDPYKVDTLSSKIFKNCIDNYSYQYHELAEKPNSLKFNSK